VHGLPLADVVELVELGALDLGPPWLLWPTLVEGAGLASGQVPEERGESLGEVRLRRSWEVALHRTPR
jgi:hypothetical protein